METFPTNSQVRLTSPLVGNDNGAMIELRSGMMGRVVEERTASIVIEFSNYRGQFEVPKIHVVRISENGNIPPAFWNEGLRNPSATIREMNMIGHRTETALTPRGNLYFIEDQRESQIAYGTLTLLSGSLGAVSNAGTSAVANLIRSALHELKSPAHSSIVRDLNSLLADVISPLSRMTSADVVQEIQQMTARLVNGARPQQ